jgi:hypothetical protein
MTGRVRRDSAFPQRHEHLMKNVPSLRLFGVPHAPLIGGPAQHSTHGKHCPRCLVISAAWRQAATGIERTARCWFSHKTARPARLHPWGPSARASQHVHQLISGGLHINRRSATSGCLVRGFLEKPPSCAALLLPEPIEIRAAGNLSHGLRACLTLGFSRKGRPQRLAPQAEGEGATPCGPCRLQPVVVPHPAWTLHLGASLISRTASRSRGQSPVAATTLSRPTRPSLTSSSASYKDTAP